MEALTFLREGNSCLIAYIPPLSTFLLPDIY